MWDLAPGCVAGSSLIIAFMCWLVSVYQIAAFGLDLSITYLCCFPAHFCIRLALHMKLRSWLGSTCQMVGDWAECIILTRWYMDMLDIVFRICVHYYNSRWRVLKETEPLRHRKLNIEAGESVVVLKINVECVLCNIKSTCIKKKFIFSWGMYQYSLTPLAVWLLQNF